MLCVYRITQHGQNTADSNHVPTHLTTSVAKFPAAMDVWGSWHGIADTSHANVSKSQVDYDEVGGSAELPELHKHEQHHNVAC